MIIIVIMMFTMLVLWGSLAFAFSTMPPENGRFLLGITLPKEHRGETEVQEVISAYKKSCRRITWWGFAGCFLVIPLNGYLSILIVFIMGLFAFLYYLFYENIRRNAQKLYEIKCKNGWLTGPVHLMKKGNDIVPEAVLKDGTELYGDDDEYWLKGAQGRKSSGKLVEKRIGIGWTTNASLVPTVGEKAVWVVMFLFVIGIAIFMMPFDFTKITMDIDGQSCRVQGASMGHTIDLGEVVSVTMLDERPDMSKKHGYDSNRFLLGDFRVQGYGACKVYVALGTDSVIKVDTADDIIWFNGATEEQTEQFYLQLKKAALNEVL